MYVEHFRFYVSSEVKYSLKNYHKNYKQLRQQEPNVTQTDDT
jgi:hypothetical protein